MSRNPALRPARPQHQYRVPSELTAAPSLRTELALVLGTIGLALWALPDLSAWFSAAVACR